MGVLSNVDIMNAVSSGRLVIDPYEDSNVQAATIDLRVGNRFLFPEYYLAGGRGFLDSREDFPYIEKEMDELMILPHHFVLGTTVERLSLPDDLAGRVDGKSRIGRRGLIVQTAGHITPGFSGEITLELFNANQMPIRVKYMQPICQVEFHELKTPSTRPYSGSYSGQRGPKV
ncbi:MAG: dCTP deaminase [Nanoarchaeota archaeon]|nr:dCTP deaminase [Nanoarchaeota archaeon]